MAGRTSSFSFKGKNATNVEIGRALNVARVIEGSVRKAGNKVRITVQLINAADGYHLWSEAFDRDLTDIFAVQSEIAAKVAQKISGGPTVAATTATASTTNLAAHDAYLRGRALQTAGNSASLAAVAQYEEVVRLDPAYALAWAQLAQTLGNRYRSSTDRSEQTAAKARNATTTALRLNPDLPEAHLAMALIRFSLDHDLDAARRELDETERLRPNFPDVPATRALLELARGRWGDGLVSLTVRAVELDPLNATTIDTMGLRILRFIGRFADAERLFIRSLELSPNSRSPIQNRAENYLAWTGDLSGSLEMLGAGFAADRGKILAQQGKFLPAIAAYEEFRAARASRNARTGSTYSDRVWWIISTFRVGWLEARLGHDARAAELSAETLMATLQFLKDFPDESFGLAQLATIRAGRGERSEAFQAIDEAMRIETRNHDAGRIVDIPLAKAEILTLLGETEAAIAELRAIHEMGYAFGYLLRRELAWEPLRGDANFQQLMKEAEARADAHPLPKK